MKLSKGHYHNDNEKERQLRQYLRYHLKICYSNKITKRTFTCMTPTYTILYQVCLVHIIIDCCNVKDYFITHYFINFYNNNNAFVDITPP